MSILIAIIVGYFIIAYVIPISLVIILKIIQGVMIHKELNKDKK